MSLSIRKQLQFWLIGLAVFFVLLYFLSGMLTPFVAGMAVAYFLDPVCDRLERMGFNRTVATTILTLAFVIAIVGVLLLLIPTVVNQLAGFVSRLPVYIEALRGQVESFLTIIADNIDPAWLAKVKETLSGSAGKFGDWLTSLLTGIVTGAGAFINFLSILVITPVVAFYLLRDWDAMVDKVDSWFPREHAEVIREQLRLVDQTLAGFVRGQATVCLILGAYYAIGLSLAGLDFGLLIGLIAGLLTFIPYVGSITGLVASVGMALVQFDDWVRIAIVAAIFFAGQAVEGNYLTPKLVGGRVGLHAVWVIFALLAGGYVLGFVGVLLAVPVAAVIGVGARFLLGLYLQSPFYLGEETAGQVGSKSADGNPKTGQ